MELSLKKCRPATNTHALKPWLKTEIEEVIMPPVVQDFVSLISDFPFLGQFFLGNYIFERSTQ